QKPVNSSRSSSGVSRSDEKIVGEEKETEFSGASWRVRRCVFIAVLPSKNCLEPGSSSESGLPAAPQRPTITRRKRQGEMREDGTGPLDYPTPFARTSSDSPRPVPTTSRYKQD